MFVNIILSDSTGIPLKILWCWELRHPLLRDLATINRVKDIFNHRGHRGHRGLWGNWM